MSGNWRGFVKGVAEPKVMKLCEQILDKLEKAGEEVRYDAQLELRYSMHHFLEELSCFTTGCINSASVEKCANCRVNRLLRRIAPWYYEW